MPGTVRLHRVLSAPAERVYRAFLDPAALAKWLPPDGFTCTVHAQGRESEHSTRRMLVEGRREKGEG